jgi:hypothetical protein
VAADEAVLNIVRKKNKKKSPKKIFKEKTSLYLRVLGISPNYAKELPINGIPLFYQTQPLAPRTRHYAKETRSSYLFSNCPILFLHHFLCKRNVLVGFFGVLQQTDFII